ncbi:LOW QUALITY PROTEIN: Spastin [Trema orientale]|uniref:Spastin n=1 Tax=Trema orientale TaxID=63057 RepID=A0A2P5F761_TREOI|nr:LOW QUALITY PROTEIN: Spastin [Trema orientale]
METDGENLVLSMDDYQRVTDEFHGAKVWWGLRRRPAAASKWSMYGGEGRRFYKLTFHKRYRELIIKSYLVHVMKNGKEISKRNRPRKLYTNCAGSSKSSSSMWSHIVFDHKASFETIALDYEKKQEIVEDLLAFSKNKDFYERAGKAWKRGYLLYGPPGTGKSTMIAAMANLLSYDVYDLELTAVKDNIELRRLLIETTSKSIVVIEDIDCSLDLTGQRNKMAEESCSKDEKDKWKKERKESRVTLSGLLNFIDGIWSSCGSERLIVFTTNHVEKLDPALIRRVGWTSILSFPIAALKGSKFLPRTILENHQMFERVESLIGVTKITPADVAESLMPKSPPHNDPETCLSNLIQALEEAKELEAEKSKGIEPTKN